MVKKAIERTKIKADYLNGATPKELAEKYDVEINKIYKKVEGSSQWKRIKTLNGGVFTFTDKKVVSGEKAYYGVSAVESNGVRGSLQKDKFNIFVAAPVIKNYKNMRRKSQQRFRKYRRKTFIKNRNSEGLRVPVSVVGFISWQRSSWQPAS